MVCCPAGFVAAYEPSPPQPGASLCFDLEVNTYCAAKFAKYDKCDRSCEVKHHFYDDYYGQGKVWFATELLCNDRHKSYLDAYSPVQLERCKGIPAVGPDGLPTPPGVGKTNCASGLVVCGSVGGCGRLCTPVGTGGILQCNIVGQTEISASTDSLSGNSCP